MVGFYFVGVMEDENYINIKSWIWEERKIRLGYGVWVSYSRGIGIWVEFWEMRRIWGLGEDKVEFNIE